MKMLFLLACSLIFNTILFSQQDNPDNSRIVAQAGNDKTTAEEFKNRFDFSPHPRKSESLDTSLIKKEYLYTLIAEKLIAQKAESLNLDTARDVKGILSYLEKLFVRDAYYKTEISNKVKITSKDMLEGEKRYSKLLVAKKEKELDNKYSNVPYIILGEGDIEKIMDSLGKNNFKKTFIKFQHDPETVNEFLTQLGYGSFKVDSAGMRNITWVFNKYVKDYIQNELLVRAAYKHGIQNLPSVKNDKKIWEDYYLSQKLERMIYDSISVSNAEAYEYYTKNYDMIFNPDEVHVKEILADSLNKIEDALKEINNGLSFEKTANKYSIIDSLKEKSGDLGYFSITTHGKIGKFANEIKVGEIYGPIKTPDGYALIKLIDKRKSGKPVDTSFTNIKDEIIGIKKGFELRERLKKYVAGLATEYGVKINTGITQINTVTVRRIGFGGRIYAFPYQPLFSDWYEVYKSQEKKIP